MRELLIILLLKLLGGTSMVEVYVFSILDGIIKFDRVPKFVKPQVEQRLAQLGYDTNGQPL